MDAGSGGGFVGGDVTFFFSCSSLLEEEDEDAENCRRLFHAKLDGWDRLERIRLLTLAERRHNIMGEGCLFSLCWF
jgi:hypothetical protein